MSNVITKVVAGRKKKEKTVKLKTLNPGDIFRFPGDSFEGCINDDDGPDFYRQLASSKDMMVEVISVDFKLIRKLPEETQVISHDSNLEIFPND